MVVFQIKTLLPGKSDFSFACVFIIILFCLRSPCALFDFDHLLRRTLAMSWRPPPPQVCMACQLEALHSSPQTDPPPRGEQERKGGRETPHVRHDPRGKERERRRKIKSARIASAHARAFKSPTHKTNYKKEKQGMFRYFFKIIRTRGRNIQSQDFLHEISLYSSMGNSAVPETYLLCNIERGAGGSLFPLFFSRYGCEMVVCVSCAAMGP